MPYWLIALLTVYGIGLLFFAFLVVPYVLRNNRSITLKTITAIVGWPITLIFYFFSKG